MPKSTRSQTAKQTPAKSAKSVKEPKHKFVWDDKIVDTKAKFKGEKIQKFIVKVPKRNASINEANAFLDDTMKDLFAKHRANATNHKMFQITYKLSDGRWYSSKYFEGIDQPFYPDLRDEEYKVDHSADMVEHINISMVTIHGAKITQFFNP
jgi:hypothetical protein